MSAVHAAIGDAVDIVTVAKAGTAMNLTTSASNWSITATKSGYKPIGYSLYSGYSTQLYWGVEYITPSIGSLTVNGFAMTTGGTFTWTPNMWVTWMKINS